MKTFLIILALAGITFGQTEISPNYDDAGFIYLSDSLYYVYVDTVGVDDTTAAVLSKSWTPKMQYEWLTIAKIDTGTTYDDTLWVKYQLPYQTGWYPVEYTKDSTWSDITQPLPIDDASQHSFKIYIADYYKLGFFITNTALDTGWVSYFKISANKKR